MENPNGQIVDSGIDWVTMSAPAGEHELRMVRWAETMAAERSNLGDLRRVWRALGYVGEKVGPVAWGRREDGAILVASGPDAERVLWKVWCDAYHLTRLDLQTTVRYDPPRPGLAVGVYRALEGGRSPSGRKVNATMVHSTDGGWTVYVGRRSSDIFGRIYDKYAESGQPVYKACWRYEIELKGDAPAGVLPLLRRSKDTASVIPSVVHRWFKERGHAPAFDSNGNVEWSVATAPPSDSERSLEWLRRQVAPTIATLRRAGYTPHVITALGLDDAPIGVGVDLARETFGSHGAL